MTALVVLRATPVKANDSGASLIASISASSSPRAALRAFDGLAETGWCPVPSDRAGELAVHFPRPVRVRSLTVYAGQMSTRHLTGGSYRPAPVEIGVGETLIKVDPRGRGQGPLVVEAARGRTAQTLTLRLPPAAPHEQRCLAEVDVDLDDGPWFWGIAQTAVDGLPAAIKTIAMSLRTCDPRFLKQVSGLPIVRRELQVGFAGAEKHLVPGRPREYSRVADLAKDCRHLVFPAGERPAQEPRLLGSVGTGVVRVEANRSGGAVYWRLRWSGHGWLLHGIDFTEFE